jgi:hypothetical protein
MREGTQKKKKLELDREGQLERGNAGEGVRARESERDGE